ncbi:conserved hypothetical protein [Methylocella silvestris BL2]|uniref:Phage gp6-like head-tail connector protein n=1 Tax=Methylocella silvestris (strain DSM 15510 / CIP 108128 / LMG 27833 / NCIMB 13906 / BL2) TaxID=395965 RepID=B8EKS9_METSB|nr:phage head-tail connector protein [Methylocella silvestris]ACK51957.1 conserved hypothetical protein [Methylocella silvestris BL2]
MASTYDLAKLADVKDWLDISGADDDALLSRLITRLSRGILNYLDRQSILPTNFSETFDGGGERSLLLGQWPVNAVLGCAVNGLPIPAAPAIAPDSLRPGFVLDQGDIAPPGRRQRLSLRGRRFDCGVQNVSVSYWAGYQIADEAITIPLEAPYSVTALSPYGDWASDGGVISNGLAMARVAASPAAGQYSVADGVYTFNGANAGSAAAVTYGYVPADLAIGCMDWVAERYSYRSRIGQQSKSLGGQETMAYLVKDIPDFVAAALQPYRRVAL